MILSELVIDMVLTAMLHFRVYRGSSSPSVIIPIHLLSPAHRVISCKSRRIRTYKKHARNSFRIRTSEFIRLKVLWNPHLQKRVGGRG